MLCTVESHQSLIFSCQTGFLSASNCLSIKLMVPIELAVLSARLFGLVLNPFPSNVRFMLNKDLTRFMPSISQVHQISHVRKAVSCLRDENKKISHYYRIIFF